MRVLELIHSLEEAYDRFGDVHVVIEEFVNCMIGNSVVHIKGVLIESEEVVLLKEKVKDDDAT